MSSPLLERDCRALFRRGALGSALLVFCFVYAGLADERDEGQTQTRRILGLTGKVSDVKVAVPARKVITPGDPSPTRDLNLKRMAEWALNYLIRTPRQDLGYEPVFQCA